MSTPLKIWLPTVRAGSGSDVFVERLAEALKRAGHEPQVEWFAHHHELTPWRLKARAAPVGTDIVHTNSWQGFAFRKDGIPLVVTEHHYVLDPAFRPFKSMLQHAYHQLLVGRYMRRSYEAASAITTDSRFTAAVLSRVVGVDVSKVVPLWADYTRFSPGQGDMQVRQGGMFRLLYVGNASVRKGVDVIPTLAQRLGDQFEIRCSSGLRTKKWGSDLGNVTVLGRLSLDQLIDEYRHCDAVLVPSRYEGFGYTALEAMACAKPVVGFRCGAVDEVVEEGNTALMCDINDLKALEENCRRLAQEPALARRLGVNGRERAVSAFSESIAVEAYLALYRSVRGRASKFR
jgi:glycosyltransferase involved in cell wall biosynthesis